MPAATLAFLGQTDAVEALARPIPGRQWPHALAALTVRNYRLYLSAQTISTTGLWMQRIAQDWLVLELSGSVAAVGIAVALQFLPVLIFGLVGGVLADRYPKRTLLMLTQTTAATLAGLLGLLALTGPVQVWHVYLIATLLGLVTAVDNPTRQVFVAELVGDRHVRNAVSLNSSVFQFGALVGPALAGVLIHAVGQGWSFLINAASCLVVVIMLAVIRLQPGTVTVPERTPGQLGAGLRYLRRVSEISWTIVLVATMGILGLNMPVILAAFANSEFANGVGGYSLFSSLTAVGALQRSAAVGPPRPRRPASNAGGSADRIRGIPRGGVAGAEYLPLRRASGRLRPVDPVVSHRRQHARPALLCSHPAGPSHERVRTRPARWTGHRRAGRGLADRPVRRQVRACSCAAV